MMIDLNLGGGCPRLALTHVLPRAMVIPNLSADAPLTGIELAVVAMNGSIDEAIPVLAKTARDHRRPWLMAAFENRVTPFCSGLVLFRPLPLGIEIGMVEPCLLKDGDAIMLVAADRTKAFAIDEAGRLAERPMPRPARVGPGIDRAW
ncbi:MAG: hypothetical protein ACOC0P_04370, partial [Planctomycetota bacterium]